MKQQTKITILFFVIIPILTAFTLNSAYGQTNSTGTNSTATNSTGTFEGIIEEIVIIDTNPSNAGLVLTSSVYNQGAMLVITGSNIPQSSVVETTVYHPDNSKFGIFKSTSTSGGEFQVLIEIAHTSIQGEYTVKSIVNDVTLTKKFLYSGGNELSFAEETIVIDETPVIIPAASTVEPTSTTSSSSTTTTTVTNDWVIFLEDLEPTDRLDLIRAVFSYLLS